MRETEGTENTDALLPSTGSSTLKVSHDVPSSPFPEPPLVTHPLFLTPVHPLRVTQSQPILRVPLNDRLLDQLSHLPFLFPLTRSPLTIVIHSVFSHIHSSGVPILYHPFPRHLLFPHPSSFTSSLLLPCSPFLSFSIYPLHGIYSLPIPLFPLTSKVPSIPSPSATPRSSPSFNALEAHQ